MDTRTNWSVCDLCGAVIASPLTHETWHNPEPANTPAAPEPEPIETGSE